MDKEEKFRLETPHLYDKELSAQGDPSGLAAPAQAETAEKKEGSALGESGAQSGQQADGAVRLPPPLYPGTAPQAAARGEEEEKDLEGEAEAPPVQKYGGE